MPERAAPAHRVAAWRPRRIDGRRLPVIVKAKVVHTPLAHVVVYVIETKRVWLHHIQRVRFLQHFDRSIWGFEVVAVFIAEGDFVVAALVDIPPSVLPLPEAALPATLYAAP